jgi:uncharacterized membrane protein YkvA (DUF1232 family)
VALSITLELDEDDLDVFRDLLRRALEGAQGRPARDIIEAAERLAETVRGARVSPFIRERFEVLEQVIAMCRDAQWRLEEPERGRALKVLAYFSIHDDLVPDDVPVLGYLDDSIIVELGARQLEHELAAYRDFCRFRAEEEARLRAEGDRAEVGREEWLAARRKALHERARGCRATALASDEQRRQVARLFGEES